MYVWNKYEKLKEEKNIYNTKIKSFLSKKNYIIKQIPFSSEKENKKVLGFIETMKNEIKIYDIIEDISYIYIAIDSDNESSIKFDKAYANIRNSSFGPERIIPGHAKYSNLSEVKKFYDSGENKVFKIEAQQNGKGSSFILEIDKGFELPFKKALFTCYHVLNDEYFSNHNYIYMKNEYNKDFKINIENSNIYTISKFNNNKNKIIKRRKIFSESFNYDYTCIELLDCDLKEIQPLKSYKIDKNFLSDIKNNKRIAIKKDIYLLHYSKGEDLSFSLGIISDIKNQNFHHTASTLPGASGSPILSRNNDCVIGLHYWGDNYFNLGLFIDDILSNIKEKYYKINDLVTIFEELKSKDLIRDNNYSYKK